MIGLGLSIPKERPLEFGFNPLDIGDCLIHYDFTDFSIPALKYLTRGVDTGRLNDNIASSGALTNNQIRIQSGYYFSTSNFPDAGVVKVDNEYFAYRGYASTSGDITALTNVTRAISSSSEAAHSTGDNISLVAGQYGGDVGYGAMGSGEGLRDFANWSNTEMRLSNLGSAGGYVTFQDSNTVRPTSAVSGLGTAYKRVIDFDGVNDRLPLDSAVVTSSGNFSVVVIFRADGSPSSEAVLGGTSGGVNQFKINANTVLFRCNGTNGAAPNAYNQIRANNTTAYSTGSRGTPVDKGGTGNSFLTNENELLIFVKEKSSADNQEKVYLYDVQDLIAEDLLNGSGTAGQSGYPDNSENPSDTEFQIEHIGALSNDSGDFSGSVAEILVYDKALTAEEVVLLQNYYDNEYPSLRHE